MKARLKHILIVWLLGNFLITILYLYDSSSIACVPCPPNVMCPPCATTFMLYVHCYYLTWNLLGIISAIIVLSNFQKQNRYKSSEQLSSQLINLINRVKKNITSDSDMTYCYYNKPDDLIDVLDGFIEDLNNKNMNVIDKIALEFAPTSSLQEHSMGNNWSDEYLVLAEEFDSIQRLSKK